MSILAQLEELQKKKAELQNELGSFDEKEKSMGTNVKMHACMLRILALLFMCARLELFPSPEDD